MATPGTREGNHAKRVIVAAVVLSVVATVLVAVLGSRFLPPGNGSTQATEQVFDNTWMTAIVTPVIVLLLVFFVYTLTQFRHRGGALVDGPPIRDRPRVRVWWIVITSVTVLFLAGFGTYELLQNGSGGGQGPSPIAIPKGKMLPVQVIEQQWQFTYRYPTYGGLETPQLVLPDRRSAAGVRNRGRARAASSSRHLHPESQAPAGRERPPGTHVRRELPGLLCLRQRQVECHVARLHTAGVQEQHHAVVVVAAGDCQVAALALGLGDTDAAGARGFSVADAVAKYLPKYSKSYYPDPQRRAG